MPIEDLETYTPPGFSIPYHPDRLYWAINKCGWTVNGFARRLGISEVTVRRMCRGRHVVPPTLANWLEAVLRALDELRPESFGWSRTGVPPIVSGPPPPRLPGGENGENDAQMSDRA